MGDVRFLVPYETIRGASDRAGAIQALSDEEVVAALAVCSGVDEPLLANVLATEAMNRLRRASAVVDGMSEAVLATDAEGRVRFANPALERMLGMTRERVMGEDARSLLGLRDAEGRPLEQDGDCPILGALLAGRASTRQMVLFNAASGPVPVLVAAGPYVREGETLGVVVSIHEESERRRVEGMRLEAAEAARREALGRIRTLERILAAQEEVARAGPRLDVVLHAVAERAMDLTGAEGSAVEMREGDELVYRAAVGAASPWVGLRIPLEGSLSGQAFREGRPARSDDAETDARVFREGARKVGARSLLVVPLMEGERRVGLLKVVSSRRGAFVEHHERTLQILAGFLSAAITRAADYEARIRSEERWRLLINAVTDYAIFMLDPDGRIASWNEGSQRIKGWTEEEAVGQPFAILFTEEDAARGKPEEEMRVAAERGHFTSEGEVRRRKDGTRFPAAVHLTALKDAEGRVLGYLKVTRDLTDRKRVEDALRESERQYRLLVENSPEPMAVHAQGRLLFLNRAAARVMGVEDPDALLGRSVIDFVHPDSRALVAQRMKAVATATEPLPPAEERFVRLDGSVIDVEVVAMPIHYQGRHAIQLIFRDVTARKRAEEGLRRFNDELEGRVRERTQALRDTLRDLETFTNSASHDLRGPLRGVDALLEGAEEELARGGGEEAGRLVERARRENRRAQRLVQDLLAFARSGQKELEVEAVDVTALAREAIQVIQAQGRGASVRWLVQEGMRARADRGLLRIALHNLLDNAAKYSARRPDAQVEVGAVPHEGGVVFHVRDNGIGIPRGEEHRLFGTFQRMANATGYDGTGLGLATVHRIVTRHGGRIWAEDTPGGGATFRFTLDPGSP